MTWREKLGVTRTQSNDRSDKTGVLSLLSPLPVSARVLIPSKPELAVPADRHTNEKAHVGLSPEVRDNPDPVQVRLELARMAHANDYLNREGVLLIEINDVATIGIWSDRDSPEIREALRITGRENMPVRYLDAPDIPTTYKLRAVDGEPVPMTVLRAMEAEANAPWVLRDRLLAEMRWTLSSFNKTQTAQPAEDPLDAAPDFPPEAVIGSDNEDLNIEKSKTSKLPRVTAFQREFFSDLAKIPAETLPELVEKSSRRGIPRECAVAYWRFTR